MAVAHEQVSQWDASKIQLPGQLLGRLALDGKAAVGFAGLGVIVEVMSATLATQRTHRR